MDLITSIQEPTQGVVTKDLATKIKWSLFICVEKLNMFIISHDNNNNMAG